MGGRHTGVCMHTHTHNHFLGNYVRAIKQRHALVSAKLISKPMSSSTQLVTVMGESILSYLSGSSLSSHLILLRGEMVLLKSQSTCIPAPDLSGILAGSRD